MIRVVHHWGAATPRFFCDWCGSRIATAAEGSVSWAYDPQLGVPLDRPIVVTHKRCRVAYETAHGSLAWAFGDLADFLLQLCRAARVNWTDAVVEMPRGTVAETK